MSGVNGEPKSGKGSWLAAYRELAPPQRARIRQRFWMSLGLLNAAGFVFMMWYFMNPPIPPGYNSLIKAIELRDAKRVASLLEHGTNPNDYPGAGGSYMTEDDISPMEVAIWNQFPDIVETMLQHGADPNLRDGWWLSPLIQASDEGNLEIMKILVRAGAKVNDDAEGSRALWIAADKGDQNAVKFLLEHGADPNSFRQSETFRQSLLQDIKEQHKNPEIAKLLIAHGAHE